MVFPTGVFPTENTISNSIISAMLSVVESNASSCLRIDCTLPGPLMVRLVVVTTMLMDCNLLGPLGLRGCGILIGSSATRTLLAKVGGM